METSRHGRGASPSVWRTNSRRNQTQNERISSVGESEESLKRKGLPYVVGKTPLNENVRANLIGEAMGFLKIIASPKDGELLGVHCIGPHASELVARSFRKLPSSQRCMSS